LTRHDWTKTIEWNKYRYLNGGSKGPFITVDRMICELKTSCSLLKLATQFAFMSFAGRHQTCLDDAASLLSSFGRIQSLVQVFLFGA
jgi:hypothetical protein